MRAVVKEIAYVENHAKLSPLKRCVIIPVLSFTSSLYTLALSLRHSLYHFRLLRNHRLAVPVISVGNLMWGGNGKTPMVEFITRFLADSGIPPLILTRVRYKYHSISFFSFFCVLKFGYMGVYKFSIFHCCFFNLFIFFGFVIWV